MELSLGQIEQAIAARLLNAPSGETELAELRATRVERWSIDSRSITSGDLFLAIKGDHFDGHAYVPSVLGSGAAAAVVSEPAHIAAGPLLAVDDTVAALGRLARVARESWAKPLIAVTGSAGKTGTKDIIAALLSTRYKVGKTIGNFNNHIGLPLSLLRLPDDAEIGVVELGMNHAGEIRHLASIARPQVGVVTNVGYAHIEAFNSIDEIAAAKRELIEALPANGVAVLNADDGRVHSFRSSHRGKTVTYGFASDADLRAEHATSSPEGSRFFVRDVEFTTALPGRHALSNILAGLAVASLFSISIADLAPAVRNLTPGKMRGERMSQAGIKILNDAYNSNPEAARSMVDVLIAENGVRKIAVLGEMLELGSWSERLHRDLGRYAAESGIHVLIGIGGASRFMVDEASQAAGGGPASLFFEDSEAAGAFLRRFVKEGDVLLFKGSRETHVERALAEVEQALAGMAG